MAEALDSGAQTRLFESVAGLFQAENFLRAKPLFEQAARGPLREMAHSARVHVWMCERRFRQAEHHLQRALTQLPRSDHLYYAIALCRGLSGGLDGA